MIKMIALVAAVAIAPVLAVAQSDSAEARLALTPDAVLESSLQRFPEILESLARQTAADGDRVAAQGAFDLVFSSDGYSRATGFWDGSVLNTDVRRNFQSYGATVYGGYRLSDGNFPIYEDINFTNTGGEFKIGALFSLLRDRDFDNRRFQIQDTQLAAEQARFDVLLTQIGVQRQALNAYWRWVAAGRQLEVYQDLLTIAEARQAGIEEQVRRGALAEIALVENQQNITRRRILVAQAERDLDTSSNAVSFYLRDATGAMIAPALDQLPVKGAIEPIDASEMFDAATDSEGLANRPELRSLRAAVDRARNRVRLSENKMRPELDVSIEVSRDVGAVAEGGISRDSTDTILGFEFSLPLEQRKARGSLQRAEAELRAARLRERRIEDQIEVEVRNILIELAASLRLYGLANDDVEQSDAMTEAERKRFASGASDFFRVNLREEIAADARIRFIRAELASRIAKTDFEAATMDLAALSIPDE